MPLQYDQVKKFTLFKQDKMPDSRNPDLKNGKVIFEVALEAGRYSFAGWQYEDTGNISIHIDRVTGEADSSGGGFDD